MASLVYKQLQQNGFSESFLRTPAGSADVLRKQIYTYKEYWLACLACKETFVKVSDLPLPVLDKKGNDLREKVTQSQRRGFCSSSCEEVFSQQARDFWRGIDLLAFFKGAGFSPAFVDHYPGNDRRFRVAFLEHKWTWQSCRQCKAKYVNVSRLPDPVVDERTGADLRLFAARQYHVAGLCSYACAESHYQCTGEDLAVRLAGFLLASTPRFYESEEWKRLRYQALKLYGAVCRCCGATPATGARLHVDHIEPRSRFPDLALDIRNTQVLCSVCNEGKGAWDDTDWREGSAL